MGFIYVRKGVEGRGMVPAPMLGGAVGGNKSKKQTKVRHWILGALYSAAAPAHATQAWIVL